MLHRQNLLRLLVRCPHALQNFKLTASRTLRFFGHSDGNGYPGHVFTNFPMQTSPGVFSEVALQRYDFVLAQCAKVLLTGLQKSSPGEPQSVPHQCIHHTMLCQSRAPQASRMAQ